MDGWMKDTQRGNEKQRQRDKYMIRNRKMDTYINE